MQDLTPCEYSVRNEISPDKVWVNETAEMWRGRRQGRAESMGRTIGNGLRADRMPSSPF